MICKRYTIVVLVLAASRQAAAAGDQSLKDRFIAEYSENFHRLESFYRNVDVTEETTGTGSDKVFGGKVTFRWRSKGEKFRDDMISQSGAIAQCKMSRGDVSCRVYAGAGKTRLANVEPGNKYAVTEIHSGDDAKLIELARNTSSRLVFAPYCVYDLTVVQFVKLESIEVLSLDESEPSKARMKYTQHLDGGGTFDGEFIFDKVRSWAIVTYRNSRLLTNIDYGDAVGDVPVAKQVTHYWNGDFKTPAFVSVLKDIKPGPVPDSVFTLAEFGLPELPYPKKLGFPIFGTLGIAGLIVAAVLAWIIRKRTAAAAATA